MGVRARRCFAGASIALWIVLLCAAPTAASDESVLVDPSVSTSPSEVAGPRAIEKDAVGVDDAETPPLTRAAAQRRIEKMSPTRWLSQYGQVAIGRRR